MNIPKKLAQIIRERLIEKKEIDTVSDLLTEIQNKHLTVCSGEYAFVFRPSRGEIASCVMAERRGVKKLLWTGQDDKEDPMEYLEYKEMIELGRVIRNAGLRAKIETRRIYQVMINGSVVTRVFNRGPQGGEVFPKELHLNEFDTQAEAVIAKRKFCKYHALFVANRMNRRS